MSCAGQRVAGEGRLPHCCKLLRLWSWPLKGRDLLLGKVSLDELFWTFEDRLVAYPVNEWEQSMPTPRSKAKTK